MNGLHNKYAGFEIPVEFREMEARTGRPIIGSRHFTKMILFAEQEKINNEIIDYYMSIPPHHQEGEPIEEYKNRTKFQKALLKYRPYIYDYNVLNN